MKPIQNHKIVLIGAGNVNTQLGQALIQNGFTISQIYNRSASSAQVLSEKLQVPFVTSEEQILKDADIYIISVKDDALLSVISKLDHLEGLCVHTAGSVPMDIFKGKIKRFGVFYPLQTFSKDRDISFSGIPVFIEAANKQDIEFLQEIALRLSGKVNVLSSEKRKYLHLAAVFACNFANHMYTLGSQVLEEQGLSWDFLLPLIEETAAKVKTIHPSKAQTGPAVRYDQTIIKKHMAMLTDDNKRKIYRLVSDSIHGE